MTVDKSLLAGSTTMLVLKLLDGQDMYGYQMIEELARRSDHAFALKTGTLYPLLHSLDHFLRKGRVCSASAPLLPFSAQGPRAAARKGRGMDGIYRRGRPRAERRRLSWFCLRLSHTLPAPRLSNCDGKRRVLSLKTNF